MISLEKGKELLNKWQAACASDEDNTDAIIETANAEGYDLDSSLFHTRTESIEALEIVARFASEGWRVVIDRLDASYAVAWYIKERV